MPRKTLTMEEFIDRAIHIHGKTYQYPEAYINSKTKISIECAIHGVFHQKPSDHLQGQGCLKCKIDNQRLTLDKVILRSRSVHGDKYDYPGPYIDTMSKMTIICHKHGKFQQNVNTHLSGSGCPICNPVNKKSTISEFIHKARKVHNNKYEYIDCYINARTKMSMVCPTHGEFEQTPDNHLHGQGCPACATFKFDYNKPAVVYLIELKNNEEHFIKVGISNNYIRRFRDINSKYPIITKLLFLFSTGQEAKEIENLLFNLKLKNYKPLDTAFKGKT